MSGDKKDNLPLSAAKAAMESSDEANEKAVIDEKAGESTLGDGAPVEVEKESAETVSPEQLAENEIKNPDKPPPEPLKPGMGTRLAGETKQFETDLAPYLPQELVGGSVPHIGGQEDESVWNAASQACGTEKVHYVYTIDEGRVWYLACPSAAMSSNPDSWCPLAAALPGNSEYWDRETVYLYELDGVASALRWDPDTARIQVFLGASRTILPRVQSMDANFVTINAQDSTIVPWRNRALRTELYSRATVRVLTYIGLLISLISVALILIGFLGVNMTKRDLTKVKFQTEEASTRLMRDATNVMQSDAIKHMVRVQELLDGLSRKNGTLVRYELNKGKLEWEALVPPAFAQEFGQPMGLEEDGRVRVKGTR